MKIECPFCHGRLEGQPGLSGKEVECPFCQKRFFIPEIIAEPADGAAKLTA